MATGRIPADYFPMLLKNMHCITTTDCKRGNLLWRSCTATDNAASAVRSGSVSEYCTIQTDLLRARPSIDEKLLTEHLQTRLGHNRLRPVLCVTILQLSWYLHMM